MALTSESHQRGLKDFLQLYNSITGFCFDKCISNFNDRHSTTKETACVDICTDNYVQYNQRFMFNFMDHQERRKKDADRVAIELAAKEAAAAQAAANETTVQTSDNDNSDSNSQHTLMSHPVSQESDAASSNTPSFTSPVQSPDSSDHSATSSDFHEKPS